MKNDVSDKEAKPKQQQKKGSGKKRPKSFLQQSMDFGFFLYNQKENFMGKAQEIISKVYGEGETLDLEEIKDKVLSLGRMIKAVFEGEYKNVSPVFLIKIGFAIAYYKYGEDLIDDDETFIGVADDMVIASWAVKSLVEEIDKFEEWEGGDLKEKEDEDEKIKIGTLTNKNNN